MKRLRIGHHPNKPLALDLFCGAGGSAMGYHAAGYNIVGVDKAPQRNFPFEFIEADALEYLAAVIVNGMRLLPPDNRVVTAVTSSPPCQAWSAMTHCRPGLADTYPQLIEPTRELLMQTEVPWVIENVEGAPLRNPITLCGLMFGVQLHRHRLFECNFPVPEPPHPEHTTPTSKAGHWKPGTIMSVAGHIAPIDHARSIMGIDWCNREELVEAIPPYMTRHIGTHMKGAIHATNTR